MIAIAYRASKSISCVADPSSPRTGFARERQEIPDASAEDTQNGALRSCQTRRPTAKLRTRSIGLRLEVPEPTVRDSQIPIGRASGASALS